MGKCLLKTLPWSFQTKIWELCFGNKIKASPFRKTLKWKTELLMHLHLLNLMTGHLYKKWVLKTLKVVFQFVPLWALVINRLSNKTSIYLYFAFNSQPYGKTVSVLTQTVTISAFCPVWSLSLISAGSYDINCWIWLHIKCDSNVYL